jgi:tRNA (cytidine/uridine-2'-O-)-methyltransferase
VEEPRLHVALIEPEIHWNTGNAGRTCLALGARLHLVGRLGFSLDERAVRRAGLDYWSRVDLKLWPRLEDFEAALPELGTPAVLTPEAPRPLWELPLGERVVLIFGRESDGLPPELRARWADRSAHLPMPGTDVRALNLSTCVGIATYEVQRRWAMGA